MANEVSTTVKRAAPPSLFSTMDAFDEGYRIARALTSSALVPAAYRGEENVPNAMIAMDMANRIGVSAIVVMQNLHVIEGRPSWASPFIVSALNSCGLFSPIRYRLERLGEREVSFDTWEGPKGDRRKVVKKTKVNDMTCVAYAIEKETGEVLEGPEVTIEMAVREGWYFRAGSKWQTMPDLMIRYRAAAFFGRLYAPHILNGMGTEEEAYDIAEPKDITPAAQASAPEAPAEEKPANRPKGIHAAMNKKPEAAKAKTEAKPAAKVIEGEVEAAEVREVPHAKSVVKTQTSDNDDPGFTGEEDDGIPFGSPDEDEEFNPA